MELAVAPPRQTQPQQPPQASRDRRADRRRTARSRRELRGARQPECRRASADAPRGYLLRRSSMELRASDEAAAAEATS